MNKPSEQDLEKANEICEVDRTDFSLSELIAMALTQAREEGRRAGYAKGKEEWGQS